MKETIKKSALVFIALVAFLASGSALTTLAAEKNEMFLISRMSGVNETPAVSTQATGKTVFTVDNDAKEINFILSVENIDNPTMAHIHLGKAGEKGNVIVNLFPMGNDQAKSGNFSGVLSRGTIREGDLTGPLSGKSFQDLIAEMKNNNTYVNVHTGSHPDGEIRSQIRMINLNQI